ncbi:MAG: hypothetical protein C0604_09545, partial [Clostridiales bacterium]
RRFPPVFLFFRNKCTKDEKYSAKHLKNKHPGRIILWCVWTAMKWKVAGLHRGIFMENVRSRIGRQGM